MSKIGNLPLIVPPSVTITVTEHEVQVKGKGGQLTIPLVYGITCKKEGEGNTYVVSRRNDTKEMKSVHGTLRTLIANAVAGVDYYCGCSNVPTLTSGEIYFGIGDVSITSGVHVFANSHIGFKMLSSGLYATCANGTTETATLMTASYTTVTGVMINIRNGYVEFYYRTSAGWSSATTISTNIPSGLVAGLQWSAASNGTGGATIYFVSSSLQQKI